MRYLQSLRSIRSTAAVIGTAFYLEYLAMAKAIAAGFGAAVPSLPGTASGDVRGGVANTLRFILSFLALLAIIFVIVGGIRVLTAGGNEENVTKGRKTIIYALIGLLIVFFARLAVNFVTGELANQFSN